MRRKRKKGRFRRRKRRTFKRRRMTWSTLKESEVMAKR